MPILLTIGAVLTSWPKYSFGTLVDFVAHPWGHVKVARLAQLAEEFRLGSLDETHDRRVVLVPGGVRVDPLDGPFDRRSGKPRATNCKTSSLTKHQLPRYGSADFLATV
ncbi:hypothetical protein [Glutamicibacter soli]